MDNNKYFEYSIEGMDENEYFENYFEHYMVCFETLQVKASKKGFEEAANTYINIEGFEGFKKLIEEILLIREKDDWDYFVELASEYKIEGLDKERIKEMANVAVGIYNNFTKRS